MKKATLGYGIPRRRESVLPVVVFPAAGGRPPVPSVPAAGGEVLRPEKPGEKKCLKT